MKTLGELQRAQDALWTRPGDAEPRKRLYPSYIKDELKKWLLDPTLDPAIRAKVEEEIAARKAGTSTPKVTPQILGGKVQPKIGRL